MELREFAEKRSLRVKRFRQPRRAKRWGKSAAELFYGLGRPVRTVLQASAKWMLL